MDINEEKCCRLLDGVELSRTARVLVSWHEKKIAGFLKSAVPTISVEYLMDMDFEAFIQQKKFNDNESYDFIFDNGLLADTCMDGVLLRSLGMHLKNDGRLRSILPATFDRNMAGRCSYENNFDRAILVSTFEAGNTSFYIAEFSIFQKKVTWLQSFYTSEMRRELAFLLQRIDFDVQLDESIKALTAFLHRYDIDSEYLRFFVDTSVVHKDKLYQLLFA